MIKILLKWMVYTILVSIFGWIVIIPLVLSILMEKFIFRN